MTPADVAVLRDEFEAHGRSYVLDAQ
jgi:hypothetical protein